MRLGVALLVLAWAAAGQSTARIEGRVVSPSGEAIRKVTVRLQLMGQAVGGSQPLTYVEVSDGAGKFAMEGLPAGRYQISASRMGFTTVRTDSVITLQSGQVKADVEIKLVPLGVISGQITDQDGDPVAGAQVQAMRFQYNGTRRQLVGYGYAQSDDQGNFRMLNIQPGRYYVLADDQTARSSVGAQERRGRSAQEANVFTLYPSASDVGGAVPVEVGAGVEVRGVNTRLNKARLFTIRGKAVDSRTGAPVSLQLSLRPKGGMTGIPGNQFNAASAANTGGFEFRAVMSGTYVLLAAPKANGPNGPVNNIANLTGLMEVTVSNSDVDGLVFTPSPPLEITGTVRAEGGDLRALFPSMGATGVAPAGSVVTARGSISLVNADESFGATPNAQVDTDGTFKIQNAAWSRYTVAVRPLAAGVYIKSIRLGGQDGVKSPLDLTAGAGGVLEILLSPKAGEVNATVHGKNGEVETGIAVTMWPKTPVAVDPLSGRVVRTVESMAKLTGVPPGEYYVAAWEEVDGSLVAYPDFLARFTGQATTVKVGESDKISVDLTLISKDKIAAEVAKLP